MKTIATILLLLIVMPAHGADTAGGDEAHIKQRCAAIKQETVNSPYLKKNEQEAISSLWAASADSACSFVGPKDYSSWARSLGDACNLNCGKKSMISKDACRISCFALISMENANFAGLKQKRNCDALATQQVALDGKAIDAYEKAFGFANSTTSSFKKCNLSPEDKAPMTNAFFDAESAAAAAKAAQDSSARATSEKQGIK